MCHGTQNHWQRRSIYAFSISWSNLECDAFHPFNLLPQILRKIRENQALMLLIALVWSTQSWYPLRLQLLIDRPVLLPKKDNLLFLPQSKTTHPMKVPPISGRMDAIWKSLGHRGFSDQAPHLINASWTTGRDKQYHSKVIYFTNL